LQKEASFEVNELILAALVGSVFIMIAAAATMVSIAILRNARANDRMAAALEERNKIEACKTDGQLEAFRRDIHHETQAMIDKALRQPPIAGNDFWEDGLEGRVADPTVQMSKSVQLDTDTPPGGGVFGPTFTRLSEHPPRRLPDELRPLEGKPPLVVAQDPALQNMLWEHELSWIRREDHSLGWGAHQVAPVPNKVFPWHVWDEVGHTWHSAYQTHMRENYGFEVLELEQQYPSVVHNPHYIAWNQHRPGHTAP
jgi:hypothetical protein